MKKFEMPVIEVERFSVKDIVTSSGIIHPGGDNELPIVPRDTN